MQIMTMVIKIPHSIQSENIQCLITNFAVHITAYTIAHITIKAKIRTNQCISEPNRPPGETFHAIL